MEMTMYQAVMMLSVLLANTAGAVLYVSKIKNELTTRVAVLEAGHTSMTRDLEEIKNDVKELLRYVHSHQGLAA
jgi:hypothetical protein